MEKTTKFSILSPEYDVKRLIFLCLARCNSAKNSVYGT
uniref:Uncharacterized protein n=1 Tax=Siphoviridae sp. ctpGU1 TaxID=2823601 RepID=A0A8S5LC39_9CAUD|nr:MAG TPA: hypothetical protein [Siphoviridae sp. ctpGU1]DAQ41830.1 MAG TPA: hypothetical protein [Caudoviricetes sp.]